MTKEWNRLALTDREDTDISVSSAKPTEDTNKVLKTPMVSRTVDDDGAVLALLDRTGSV